MIISKEDRVGGMRGSRRRWNKALFDAAESRLKSKPDHPGTASQDTHIAGGAPERAPQTPKPAHGLRRFGNKRGLLIATGAAGLAGAGGLVYDHKRRRAGVSKMDLVNPFEVNKGLMANPASGTNVRSVTPILPRGAHVPHENDLSVTRHTSSNPKNSKLALYRSGSRSAMTGGGKTHGNAATHVRKDTQTKPSGGRQALGGLFPGVHGAVAGKKGHKIRAAANEALPAYAGSLPGTALTVHGIHGDNPAAVAGGVVASQVGRIGGGVLGTRRAQRKGHLQREVTSKSLHTQQGASRMGSRGTPMSDLGNVGRVGRRVSVL